MPEPLRVLILGGTTESALLADRLAHDSRVAVTTSLAGRTRRPAPVPGTLRVGGFGGAQGLAAWLAQSGTQAVVDATHPFAAGISAHAATACALAGVPRLQLLRPAWEPGPGDDWRHAADIEAAAAVVAANGARRVFLSIGRQELAPFAAAGGVHFLVRMIDAPDRPPPLADCEVLLGRGPFREADETALFRERGIELVVAKNSGGDATRAKLDAARALGLPVVMVERPTPPPGPRVETVGEALAWIEDRIAGAVLPLRAGGAAG
jgi:precorrin-6A/cobalt-precorrin-6A reductase